MKTLMHNLEENRLKNIPNCKIMINGEIETVFLEKNTIYILGCPVIFGKEKECVYIGNMSLASIGGNIPIEYEKDKFKFLLDLYIKHERKEIIILED